MSLDAEHEFLNGTSFAYFHGPAHVILFIEMNPPTQTLSQNLMKEVHNPLKWYFINQDRIRV